MIPVSNWSTSVQWIAAILGTYLDIGLIDQLVSSNFKLRALYELNIPINEKLGDIFTVVICAHKYK